MKDQIGFLNVYNFIPFPEKKSTHYEEEDRHTGVIAYTITTKTPLFIPNTSNAEAYEGDGHRCYDFFSYTHLQGKTNYQKAYSPVVPGSELRGMIRNIYETLTSSCMGVFNEKERPVKRTAEMFQQALIKRGKDGKFELIKAEDIIFRENNDKRRETYKETSFHEGQKVYYKKIERRDSNKRPISSLVTKCWAHADQAHVDQDHLDSGYLIKGESGETKKNAHIFEVQSEERIFELTQRDLDGLDLVLRDYQEQPQSKTVGYEEYREAYSRFRKGGGEEYFPVYYSDISGPDDEYILYLAPAKITKEISKHVLEELAGDMNTCREKETRCPACDLFGMVGKNNEESMSSKIRFADAVPEKEQDAMDYYMQPVVLQELSGPKLGNTEFYLEQPENADFWTYDYYIQDGTTTLAPGKLRGRKFYWNQPDIKLPACVQPGERNATVRPVRTGVTFCGQLYYHRISEKQLQQLVWILNGGSRSEKEKDIVYKLGSGKPLGLGSVQLKVTEVRERTLEEKDGYLCYEDRAKDVYLDVKSYDENGFEQSCKNAFFNLVSFKKMRGIPIHYPMTEQQKKAPDEGKGLEEGYLWFGANHRFYELKKGEGGKLFVDMNSIPQSGKMGRRRVQCNIHAVLPSAEGFTLMPYLYGADKEHYVGEVTGISENGKKLILVLPDERKVRLHVTVISRKLGHYVKLDEMFQKKDKVEIKYLGLTKEGHPEYEFIGKIGKK